MKIRLGYVAISTALDNVTSSSIMTYSHYCKLGLENGNAKLDKIIKSNFSDLKSILDYNIKNDITFYRMTSKLIPLSTHEKVSVNLNDYKDDFEKIGDIIKKNNMRVDTHPDQFCVLNSVREEVVNNSIVILKEHQKIFNLMKYNGLMILHVGSGAGGKKESMKRFKENFLQLDKSLQSMIILENDDKTFNVANTLSLCEELNIPMVLDYHHHICNKTSKKIEDYIERIMNTWKDKTPKMHFSSPKNKKEIRSHNDYIDVDQFVNFIERIKFIDKDIDIMLEAKMKDEALFRLVRLLKYKTNYKFIDGTTFVV